MNQKDLIDLKELISNEKKIIKKMFVLSENLDKTESMEERKMVISSILSLKSPLQNNAENILERLEKTIVAKPLPSKTLKKEGVEEKQLTKPSPVTKVLIKKVKLTKLEENTLKRLKKRRGEIIYKKKIKPSTYIELATRIFSKTAKKFIKKDIFKDIERELPFATIHMSSIAGSMINPSKIFNIILETREYPHLEKEFTKLINEINVYGYDLVTALRNMAFNCPSLKLSELYNGLAVTINSGGNLPGFFEERSKSLLFEYRLDREKLTKSSETFMDIYISVVIAAPMIFMLLLMMMKISGLGLSLSTSMISLIMILGVSMINVVFLVFLQLKQPGG